MGVGAGAKSYINSSSSHIRPCGLNEGGEGLEVLQDREPVIMQEQVTLRLKVVCEKKRIKSFCSFHDRTPPL